MTYSAARGTRHEGEEDSASEAGAQAEGRPHMLKNLIKLFKDEEGATALEYGLMAAAVAGVLIVIAYFLGGKISSSINNVAQHM
jgi:pilus assembly protein Flp/PilA